MSGKKSGLPDGRVPDRNPDGTPAVPWKSRWTEGPLPLWLVATAGGMAVMFVVGLFFYGAAASNNRIQRLKLSGRGENLLSPEE